MTDICNCVVGPWVWKRCDVRPMSVTTGYFSGMDRTDGGNSQNPQADGAYDYVSQKRAQIVLGTVTEVANHVRHELLDGCGFTLLKNIVSVDTDVEDLKRRYCDFGRKLGKLVPQNADGDLLRAVTYQELSFVDGEPSRAYGHRGRSRMSPHTDSADFAALFCIRPARSGGVTSLCSASAIYNEILNRCPEYLEPLSNGFYFDLTGKTKIGLAVTKNRVPVFSFRGGDLTCVFNRDRIVLGMSRVGLPLEEIEWAAINYLDALAQSDEFTYKFALQAGDILLLNNRRILHGRDEYDDWPEPNRRRLLLRLWINEEATEGFLRATE